MDGRVARLLESPRKQKSFKQIEGDRSGWGELAVVQEPWGDRKHEGERPLREA